MKRERQWLLLEACTAIFKGNRTPGDFADVHVKKIEREFPQDPSGGVEISFSVSNHYLGKIDRKGRAALSKLLGEELD